MAAISPDNAGNFDMVAPADTIAGPIYIDRIKWHGGAIALGNVVLIEGLLLYDLNGVAIDAGSTRGTIFNHTAGAADEVWVEYIGAVFADIVVTTWTSNNGTLHIFGGPLSDIDRAAMRR